jgi:maleylacetoacetate isomerase/maleylpyruvate isomerase
MSTERFDLYSYWRTSATYRVRVALNLKGLHAHEINVDIDAGEQRSEAFLRINPMGGIPALVDNAVGVPKSPISQSLAILEYLDEIAPMPPLLPPDAPGRARVRSIASMIAADTHPLITPRVKKYLTGSAGFDDQKWRAWQINWFTTGLQALEQQLTLQPIKGRLTHGDDAMLSDICLASIIVVARVFKIKVQEIPTVNRIMAELEQLPAFARADPHRQAGAPLP